jgi:integrase
MIERTRYQSGSLTREARKAGPAVWVFQWRETTGQGIRARRKAIVGTVNQFPTKALAKRAVESQGLRTNINNEPSQPRTVGQLIEHYRATELGKAKSYSTRTAYECYLRNWVIPKWSDVLLSNVKTVAVEQWLGTMSLSNGSKAKVRNIMSALFTHACRHEWSERNPIKLVRQSAKRESVAEVLTPEEINGLLVRLPQPYSTMVLLAVATGLRVSELLAMKWADIKFDDGEIHLLRAIVCQHVGDLKTEASGKPLPMAEELGSALLSWRAISPYNQNTDYVFASEQMRGQQPLWPSSAMAKHIRPAAQRVGIKKHVRWHVFRHTYATLLKSNGADVKVTQELMRHANASTTLDIYTQAITEQKRAAQRQVLQVIGPVWPRAHTAVLASA